MGRRDRARRGTCARRGADGEGIDTEFLPHVFDRFRQADSSITRPHEGLGLGLAIVKQLVELHGGSVGVHSDGRGRGASFTLELPLRRALRDQPQDVAQSVVSEAAPRAHPLRALRLLVVENDDDARAWLRHVLTDHGAEVDSAGSAQEALALLERAVGERALPDVLVSDIGMPDGLATTSSRRRRAARGTWRTTPAIAVTAFARPEDRERAFAAGYHATWAHRSTNTPWWRDPQLLPTSAAS